MATNLDTSGNYLLLDNEGVKYSIPKKNARVRENANGTIRIFDDSGLLNDIPDSILSGVYTDFADSTGTPFGSLALLLTWLRDNTAFSTGGGNGDGVTEDTLPIGGLVFDKPRFYKINQSTALDIEKAVIGHDSSNTLIPIYLNIIGDETNAITTSITEIDLAGDALDNTKNNFVVLVGLNGNVVSYGNQISELPPIPDEDAPIILSESLFSDNTYTDVTFDEGVYASGGGAVLVGQVSIIDYTDNLDDASSVTIGSITNTSGSALSGGETVIRVHHTTDVDSNGLATFKIRFTAIEDVLGNSATRTTSDITLNDVYYFTPFYQDLTTIVYNGTSGSTRNIGSASALINNANFEILHRISVVDGQPSANKSYLGARSQVTGKKGGFWYFVDTAGKIQLKYTNSLDVVTTLITVASVNANGAVGQKTINIRKEGSTISLYVDGVLVPLDVSTLVGSSAIADINAYSGCINVDGTLSAFFEGTQKALVWHNDLMTPLQRASKIAEIEAL